MAHVVDTGSKDPVLKLKDSVLSTRTADTRISVHRFWDILRGRRGMPMSAQADLTALSPVGQAAVRTLLRRPIEHLPVIDGSASPPGSWGESRVRKGPPLSAAAGLFQA